MKKYQLSQSTLEQIGHYVYVLIDPRDGKIFYVGKGTRNRINDHIKGIFKENKKESEKNKKIDEIIKSGRDVKQIIIRHRIKSIDEAFNIEAAIIDILSYEGYKLTNIVKGHKSNEVGIMDLDDIKIKYEAEHANFNEDPVLLININILYKKGMTYNEIYEATRKSWPISPKNANKAKYVCSIYKGIVREVFEINKSREIDKKRCEKNPGKKPKYMFTGKLAGEKIRNKYLHKSVSNYRKQGAQFPIKYVNI